MNIGKNPKNNPFGLAEVPTVKLKLTTKTITAILMNYNIVIFIKRP